MRQHRMIPDSVSGYQLDAEQSFWWVCQAEATENLMINPSFEFEDDTLGDPSWMTQDAYQGTLAFDGQSIERTVTTPTTAIHTWSAYMQVPDEYPSIQITARIFDGATELKAKFYELGRRDDWTRIEIPWNAVAETEYTLTIEISSSLGRFITDCWQVEAKPYATTYVDGDTGIYFPADRTEFRWSGTAHQSPSIRTAKTRMGGRWIPLSDFGFMTTSIQGFGKAPVNQSFQTALSGRYVPEAMFYGQRELVVGGTIMAKSHKELIAKRKELSTIFSPHHYGEWKPLRLKAQLDYEGREYEIAAYYSDGMQGEVDNLYRQNWAISLTTETPYWLTRPTTGDVTSATDSTSYRVLSKDWDSGAWTYWEQSATGNTYAFDHDGAGNYYSAGTQSGLVHRLRVVGTGGTTVIGGGLGGTAARGIAVSKSGPLCIAVIGDLDDGGTDYAFDIYMGGSWNSTTVGVFFDTPWPGPATFDGSVVKCIEWANGEFYVGGSFSHNFGGVGGTAQSDLIAAYNPATDTWRTVGIYPLQRTNNQFVVDPGSLDDHVVTSLRYGNDGYLYISGKWLPNTGFGSNSVVKYHIASNIIEDVEPDLTMDADFYGFHSMAVSPGGVLHGLGYDPAITKLMYPSGDTWVTRTMQPAGTVTDVATIDFAPDGTLLLGGALYQWGDMTPQPYSLLWSIAPIGSNPPFAPVDMIFDTNTQPTKTYTAMRVMNRQVFLGVDGTGSTTVVVSTQSEIVNHGDEVTRAGIFAGQRVTIYNIRNETTGKQIVLDSPIVVPAYGYVAILERYGALYLHNLAVQSETPTLIKYNRALSDITALDLIPGPNSLNILYTSDTGGSEPFIILGGVSAFWQERHSTI